VHVSIGKSYDLEANEPPTFSLRTDPCIYLDAPTNRAYCPDKLSPTPLSKNSDRANIFNYPIMASALQSLIPQTPGLLPQWLLFVRYHQTP
jgi:hypothetical protein